MFKNTHWQNNKSLLIPVGIGVLFLVVVLVTLSLGSSKYYSVARLLTQWDGQHYQTIAADGYQITPCATGFPPGYICGNVGWFPLYPLAVKILSWLPVSLPWLMLVLNWVIFLWSITILYRIVEKLSSSSVAVFTIIATCCFPGSFYFLAGFPYALFFLLSLLIFRMLINENYSLLWLVSGLLALTYPSGVIIVLPLLVLLLNKRTSLPDAARLNLLFAILSPAVALLLFASYYWFKFDNFFLYLDFQGQGGYDHELSFPLVVLIKQLAVSPAQVWSDLQKLLQSPFNRYIIELNYTPIWLVLVYLVLGLGLASTRKIPLGWQLFMWGVILFTPTMGTADCYYRHIIIAWPLFLMLGYQWENRRKRWLVVSYLALGLLLMLTVYLPLFKIGQLM